MAEVFVTLVGLDIMGIKPWENVVKIFACFTVTSKLEQVDIKISHGDPIFIFSIDRV